MKYIVMECHEGYAILMDEDSRFVTAANLGYKVGQTVTEPVIMTSDDDNSSRRRRNIILKVTAAAACLVLMCGTGYHYYSVNYKTYSTVIISSNAGVKLDLNKKGKVIKIESTSPEGEAILSDYDGKGKDKNSAINDILEIGISKGYLSGGDTVSVYISDDKNDSDSFRQELESDLADMELKADIKPIEQYKNEAPTKAPAPPEKPTVEAPEPPSPPAADDNGKEVHPPHENGKKEPEVLPPPTDPDKPEPPSPPHEPPTGKDENRPDEPTPPEEPQPPTDAHLPEDDPLHKEHDEKLPHEREAHRTDPAEETHKTEKSAPIPPEPALPLPEEPKSLP